MHCHQTITCRIVPSLVGHSLEMNAQVKPVASSSFITVSLLQFILILFLLL